MATIVIIVMGVMIAVQQKAIRDIQTRLEAGNTAVQQTFVANTAATKEMTGTIKNIGNRQMTVVARVPDIERLAASQNQTGQAIPVADKTYTVSLSPDTAFTSITGPENAQFSEKDFQVGDNVRIETEESIFDTDHVAALSVTYIGGRKVPLGSGVATTQQNVPGAPSIKGTIVAIKDTTMAIQVGTSQGDSSPQVVILKIALGATTKFLERTLKSPSEISSILEQYAKSPAGTSVPKLYTSERAITKGDLKIGDRVGIYGTQQNDQTTATTVVRLIQP